MALNGPAIGIRWFMITNKMADDENNDDDDDDDDGNDKMTAMTFDELI